MVDVIATGTAVNSTTPERAKLIEDVMTKAILDCYARGITDASSILAAKLEAFEKFKASSP